MSLVGRQKQQQQQELQKKEEQQQKQRQQLQQQKQQHLLLLSRGGAPAAGPAASLSDCCPRCTTKSPRPLSPLVPAGVYFEKYVKGKHAASLWVRNIQLGMFGVPLRCASHSSQLSRIDCM
jgi:hypothetical protein